MSCQEFIPTSDDEGIDLMMNVKADVIYRMMKLNMSFKDTALYKILAKKVIESIRADIKCGRILVNGNYSTVLGNSIEMLQESIGKYKPETTIVGKVNIISTAFPKKQLCHIFVGITLIRIKESVGKNSVNLMLTLEVKAVRIKQKILRNRKHNGKDRIC